MFARYTSSYFFRLIFVFFIYFLLSELGLLAFEPFKIKIQIWPASGVAAACVLLWGYSVLPALFFATIFLKIINNNLAPPLLIQIVANIIEPLLTAYFCSRGNLRVRLPDGNFHKSLDRMRDVFRLIGGALLGGLSGAVIMAAAKFPDINWFYFIQYWAGHSIGIFMFMPLILVLTTSGSVGVFYSRLKEPQVIVFALSTLAVTLSFIFFNAAAWLYLLFPLVLWSALQLGQKETLLVVFFLSLIVIFKAALESTTQENKARVANENSLVIFAVTLQLTGLIVAAANLERKALSNKKEKQMELSYWELEKKMRTLQQEKERAVTSSEAKSLFLANVSHEIRTPLDVVLGFSDLLTSENLSEADRKEFSMIIKRNGMQLSSVISDVLDLSKIEAGKFEIQNGVVLLEDLLLDIKSTLSLQASKKGLNLTFNTKPNVPKKIFTDPIRLRQILINIIGNAIRFTDQGSVEIKIKIAIDQKGLNKVAFVVSDTGIGIPADKIKDLFSPFMQIDVSPARRFGGTGLGLALSQKLATALGGQIILSRSVLGQGSEFILTIDPGDAVQIAQEEKRQEQKSSVALPPQKLMSSKTLQHKKILVVDDSPDNLNLLSYYMHSAGATVDKANDGAEAIQKVHSGQYDIILMDLQMPVMNGYAATEVLRKEGYRKPIIALTAHTLKEVGQRCQKTGFDTCIIKPVARKDLLQTITEFSV